MIQGQHDTYFTVEELGRMISRDEKTIRNWAASGRLQFVHLCGVPLISMAMLENLITGVVPPGAGDGKLALRLSKRTDSRARGEVARDALTRSPARGSMAANSNG